MNRKILLDESDTPTPWYNIVAAMPNKPIPPLNPETKEPVGPEDLSPIFPMGLIEQEVTTERYIEIPEQVREIYRLWRPSPLFRARGLEKALDTPATRYSHCAGGSPSGSDQPNTAAAQA